MLKSLSFVDKCIIKIVLTSTVDHNNNNICTNCNNNSNDKMNYHSSPFCTGDVSPLEEVLAAL